jgi:hypothetical protein
MGKTAHGVDLSAALSPDKRNACPLHLPQVIKQTAIYAKDEDGGRVMVELQATAFFCPNCGYYADINIDDLLRQ